MCERLARPPSAREVSGPPEAAGARAGTVTFHPRGTLPSRRRFLRPGTARVVGAGRGAAGRGPRGYGCRPPPALDSSSCDRVLEERWPTVSLALGTAERPVALLLKVLSPVPADGIL